MQGGLVIVIMNGHGRLGDDRATVGPASTRNTVQPETLAPYSSASRTPCMPGNDGSKAGCVLMIRPPNLSRKSAPTSFMNPARMIRSGSKSAHAVVSARSQSSRSGKSRPGA